MPSAYILINCELGCENALIDELKTLPGVVEACQIYGSTFDIIVKVCADTEDRLKEVVNRRIRRMEKVKATQTMMVVIELHDG
ncbi:Lrp/AsnC ligand binding domain-containing protein [Nitrososphaera viennensis]|nr:Lrp/AsnC ligand binding domain-containing protein [Nitrososphaera viennensis]UVS70339.1 Lrp/AsnC ligand binding domain-containing protein [Nitrososphaera viennensis]